MDTRKLGVLGMPTGGRMSPAAARGLLTWASAGETTRWRVESVAGSAVQSMNKLLCLALNLALQGQPVSYFAMLHDDIGPANRWLDTAVDEMEAYGLDVISAVVPIKDMRGLTSTGAGFADLGDRFRAQYRLTMREVCKLPATFTAADLPRGQKGPLLVNDGCMVVRFRPEWAQPDPQSPLGYSGPCFNDTHRIVFDPARKGFYPQMESEDWAISRQFHALGLKVGATWKISLGHEGTFTYTNDHPWGAYNQDRDLEPDVIGVPAC